MHDGQKSGECPIKTTSPNLSKVKYMCAAYTMHACHNGSVVYKHTTNGDDAAAAAAADTP